MALVTTSDGHLDLKTQAGAHAGLVRGAFALGAAGGHSQGAAREDDRLGETLIAYSHVRSFLLLVAMAST